MKGLILAAGNGTRMQASAVQAATKCKVLLPLGDRTLIEHTLGLYTNLPVDEIELVTGAYTNEIRGVVGDSFAGVPVRYCIQAEQKGLVHGIMQAVRSMEADDLVLALGDEVFLHPITSEMLLAFQSRKDIDFMCGVTEEPDSRQIQKNYAVDLDRDGKIMQCREKPSEVKNNWKGTGFCFFRKPCVEFLKQHYAEETNFPNDLCDWMNMLLEAGLQGVPFRVAEQEININTQQDYALAKTMGVR